MAHRVHVIALRAFTYDHRPVARGDSVVMVPLDASIHARRGDVTLAKQPTYRTRDVVADNGNPPPQPKRRYRRRDLTAEGSPE